SRATEEFMANMIIIDVDSESGIGLATSNVTYLIRATYATGMSTAFHVNANNAPIVFQNGGSVFSQGSAIDIESSLTGGSHSITVNAGSSLVCTTDVIEVSAGFAELQLTNYGLIKSIVGASIVNLGIASPGFYSTIDNYGEILSEKKAYFSSHA